MAINTRIIHKHDTAANWAQTTLIPKQGEIIIYDTDANYSYERFKIGDGVNTVSKLPFHGSTYAERPIYAYNEITGLPEQLAALQTQINQIAIVMPGMIMMWSGSDSAVPSGWALCDGTNGTPDLRDKFVLGAGGTYASGDVGGEAEHTLTVEEIPSHSHTYKRHEFDRNDTDPETGEDVYGANNKTLAAHTGSTDMTGGNQAHNNMPPYYALCFIMKI